MENIMKKKKMQTYTQSIQRLVAGEVFTVIMVMAVLAV